MIVVKKALVLSGGGAFGAYQAGAWKALCDHGWTPDLVVGASIGAVNGFVISRSDDPTELLRVWREMPGQMNRSNVRRGMGPWRDLPLFRAWVEELARQHASNAPRRELIVTMTELPRCGTRLVRGSEVTSRHLLAACALPGILPPVRIDGRFCIDAGVFNHLPLRESLQAGATEIIGIDLMKASPCKTVRLVRLAALRVRDWLRSERSVLTGKELARVSVLHVGHARPLGGMNDCFAWNRERIETLIETGYKETTEALRRRRPNRVPTAKNRPSGEPAVRRDDSLQSAALSRQAAEQHASE
jgi:predicted acylesterase/phospholipase RssA